MSDELIQSRFEHRGCSVRVPASRSGRVWLWVIAIVALVAVGWLVLKRRPLPARPDGKETTVSETTGPLTAERAARIETFCASCHVFPPPSSFPREAWQEEVEKGFEFARVAQVDAASMPALADAVSYFESRAPERLEVTRPTKDEAPRVRFQPRTVGLPGRLPYPGVAHVQWLSLDGTAPRDCLVADMRHGLLLVWRHDQPNLGLRPIAEVGNPAHVELVDLDRDGARDLLVADLGSFLPTDDRCGRVLWLRRDSDTRRFQSVELVRDIGRVADMQAADFDGDGDLDLIVAVFGWHASGQLLYLDNRSTDYSQPDFRPTTIEERTGAIHVPIADLNGDGRPDFVAVFGQEHEQVVGFINDGPGRFRRELIFAADDPAFGSSGIQLVDFDGDDDLDVLYTNGDTLDANHVKPYHGIQWLENSGAFPFRRHVIATMPGVHRALALDMDGDGDLDVAAAAFLPYTRFADSATQGLDSLAWFEQIEGGEFRPHSIEKNQCHHATLDVGDFNADGLPDLVTGNLTLDGASGAPQFGPMNGWITIWQNAGAIRPTKRARD